MDISNKTQILKNEFVVRSLDFLLTIFREMANICQVLVVEG